MLPPSDPLDTVLTPSLPQPSAIAICHTSHSLTEPMPGIAMVLPLRSAGCFTGESAVTMIVTVRGSPAKAATARTGAPLAPNAISTPLLRPKSTLPAVSA